MDGKTADNQRTNGQHRQKYYYYFSRFIIIPTEGTNNNNNENKFNISFNKRQKFQFYLVKLIN